MNAGACTPWLRRPWRLILVGSVVVALLAVGERSLHGLRAAGEPAHGACWIWADVPFDAPRPVAFLAVREFQLTTMPQRAVLSAVADESFVLFVNGAYVGGGTYAPGASLSRYRVEKLLRPGNNRLVVELRSGRGVGGFLAHLRAGEEDGTGEMLVRTDDAWRIFRRDERRQWRDVETISGGEPVRVWQRPPTGRWRLGAKARELPIPFRGGGSARRAKPVQMRALQSALWFDLTIRQWDPPLGPQRVYDWGEVVEGFLFFELPSAETPPALAWFGEDIPDPRARPSDEVLMFLPGQESWRDHHPRRFRYLVLVGLEPGSRPQVRRLESSAAERLAPPPPLSGVFGIEPPLAWSTAEMAVWRRLRGER